MTATSALFASSGIKSLQEGYVSSSALSTGTGRDGKYIDVTISAVDAAKAIPSFEGTFSQGGATYGGYIDTGADNRVTAIAMVRLTSSTNLRIHTANGQANLTGLDGQWRVVEAR